MKFDDRDFSGSLTTEHEESQHVTTDGEHADVSVSKNVLKDTDIEGSILTDEDDNLSLTVLSNKMRLNKKPEASLANSSLPIRSQEGVV